MIKRIPVLVIEEDNDLRELIRYNLYLDGFKVYTAADGPSGIKAALRYKPRLILLDVAMSERNAPELISTLKHDYRTRRIPVIILTAEDSTGDVDQASEIGADDYITKPFEDRKLGRIVKQKLKKCEDGMNKRRWKKISALVIDDDIGWRKAIEYNLSLDGFEVYTAADGPSGIKAALKHKPHLILLDVVMPEMDGFEVLSTLKYDSRTSRIPVIMLTAKNLVGDMDRASEIGADGYIAKPFEGKKLGTIIRQKLEKYEEAARNKTRGPKRVPVLIIDDDVSWRKVVEYNLYLDGFEVYSAADGPSGIEAALKHKPDLILLDVMMPEMDGLEVLSALKHDSRTSGIAVIMLTAKNLLGDMDRAFDIGADDYITKPFEGKKLGKTIKEKLEKRGEKIGVSSRH